MGGGSSLITIRHFVRSRRSKGNPVYPSWPMSEGAPSSSAPPSLRWTVATRCRAEPEYWAISACRHRGPARAEGAMIVGGSAWEPTPWRATQRAAWRTLTKEDDGR